ncbi:DoxX family protein [Planctomicrobium sp. SH661]|uniref:DoxX family protein n=1 Tax=Planctomicrobium sp. SH661 TaxID=3448124 RepID=UPI003F5B3EED
MIQSWVQSLGLLFLRVSFGLAMLAGHGLDKLLNFSGYAQKFPSLLGLGSHIELSLAIFAEFFCSVLVILGIATRLSVIPLIVTMLVAMTMAHASDPWKVKEMAALYLFAYITILICGGGGFSLDRVLFGWKKKSKSA